MNGFYWRTDNRRSDSIFRNGDIFDRKGRLIEMFEKISGEFNKGYTRAIQDIIRVFEYADEDLRMHHKRTNHKIEMSLLKTILENRAKLREIYCNGFIRWNVQKQDWEWFETGKDD